jgi:hypothetical protein
MTAQTEHDPRRGWVGNCRECGEAISAGMAAVHAWAELHDDTHHGGSA